MRTDPDFSLVLRFSRALAGALWDYLRSWSFAFMLGVVVGSIGAAYVLSVMLIERFGG